MQVIIISTLVLTVLGLACGVILALGARFFQVQEDPRIGAVTELLPGANCGACGFAGCAGYAAALVKDGAAPTRCPSCTSEASARIAALLGATPAAAAVRQAALVLCGGRNAKARKRFAYNGIADCAAAAATAGGDKACTYGCLGYGTCARVCPSNAISVEDGLARVHPDRCIACRRCVAACPRRIIRMVPVDRHIHVLCSSKDPGAAVRKVCGVGCIGCRICTKLSDGAIEMDGALAVVNYDKPLDNEAVVEKCPGKCIVKV
jgi:Na+-translocating ferredoxin:NAD+ oxidoreductase RNF subunit RnfB